MICPCITGIPCSNNCTCIKPHSSKGCLNCATYGSEEQKRLRKNKMNLTFAGVGSAFTDSDHYQSNMLLTSNSGKKMMIDCGTDARFSFGELGITNANIKTEIDAVYISHLHADHFGGLEWVAFCTYFNPDGNKPKLFIAETLVDDLWTSLKASLCCFDGIETTLNTFFELHLVPEGEKFTWEDCSFVPVQTIHVRDNFRIIPSYGLYIEEPKVFITTDTRFDLMSYRNLYEQSNVIFHDCETYERKSGVHAHYEDLKNLPYKYKEKMWLYHYAPGTTQRAIADGFQGFVKKGQSFDFNNYLNRL